MPKRLAAYLSRRPVALQIGTLVAATALPLILASALMFQHLVARERELARQSLMVRVKTLAALVDNQVDTFASIGWTLAGSSKLKDGDLESFRAEAEAAIRHVPGSWIVLRRLDGKAMFSTEAPRGTVSPDHPDTDIMLRAALEGKPQIADLKVSPFSHVLAPYLEVPVAGRDPGYSLEVLMSPAEFLSLFDANVQNGESVGLLDRNLRFIARIPDHAAQLGKPPSQGWRAAIAKAPEGWTENSTLEGTQTLTAYARTSAGWTVGIGEPSLHVAGPAQKLLWAIGSVSLALLALSALLASLIAARITNVMRALARAANRVGDGEVVEPPEAPFAEARAIGSALADASVELKRRGELLARDNTVLEQEVASRTKQLRREIARKSEVEEQLRQSQKMEALGQLAGGVAHDFNNMLAVIVASLELVKRRLKPPGDEKLIPHITAALGAADRAAGLIRRLLTFSRQQPLEPAVIDVNDVIGGLTDFLRRTLGEAIELETQLAPDLWPVNIDPRQLELAIVNLVVNARDATENGGKVFIRTRTAGTDLDGLAQLSGAPSRSSVVMTVADSGCGMDEATLARATEPFFTTKPVGKGTGLGLSQTHGFTQQSGGELRIRSAPQKGTTVELWFPRYQGDAPSSVQDPGTLPAPRAERGERAMVVEDEEQARALVVDALHELGYLTLEAPDAESALSTLAEAPPFDLLLTDLVMPGMNGRDLARAMRVLRPDLRVLYMTGYVRSSVLDDRDPSWELGVLRKPFSFEQLASAVRRTLDRDRSGEPQG